VCTCVCVGRKIVYISNVQCIMRIMHWKWTHFTGLCLCSMLSVWLLNTDISQLCTAAVLHNIWPAGHIWPVMVYLAHDIQEKITKLWLMTQLRPNYSSKLLLSKLFICCLHRTCFKWHILALCSVKYILQCWLFFVIALVWPAMTYVKGPWLKNLCTTVP